MKVVRDSKFRHVFGEAQKVRYDDLRLSSKATESVGIRANSKFFTVAWDSGGGGALAVVPLKKTGRLPRDQKLITGHAGPILDFEFNPFDDNMIASCSEDLTVKIWNVPDDGLSAHLREPIANLEGHSKKVSFCTFNPVAGGILGSTAFDLSTKIWDLNEQEEAFQVATPDIVTHLKWNYFGNLLAATCKDRVLRLIDPRVQQIVSECKIHEGVKASKVEWVGDTAGTPEECGKLVTTGFSSQAERQMAIWDTRMFSSSGDVEPMNMLILDQGTGAIFPHYDFGTQMLYITGKGDGNCRYFELNKEEPFMHYISQHGTTTPQKGFCFLPKRCCDTLRHEVLRGMKLENTAVQPISFSVPRKSELFQEDLFPDSPGSTPSISADEWTTTDVVRGPILVSMRPGAADSSEKTPTKAEGGVVSVKDLKKNLAEALARIVALEAENEQLKAELAKK